MILSPLTNNRTQLKSTIKSKDIIDAYQNQLGIDVSRFFMDIDQINLLECLETKYRFFHPFHLVGDGYFYEQLQKFDWYYMPWKWEHKKTLQFISANNRVLEVGSGGNGFIRAMGQKCIDATGLELNEKMVIQAQAENLKVYKQYIEEHALLNPTAYDVVCSFQVLEHISDVRSFLESQIKCLKKGGKLIICVPNNASFIRHTNIPILNMPPHHMGLWDHTSLKNLSKILPINPHKVFYEPLQPYHYDWYWQIFENRWLVNPILKKIFYRLNLVKISKRIIKLLAPWIKGHSIMVVFEKQ